MKELGNTFKKKMGFDENEVGRILNESFTFHSDLEKSF